MRFTLAYLREQDPSREEKQEQIRRVANTEKERESCIGNDTSTRQPEGAGEQVHVRREEKRDRAQRHLSYCTVV